MGQRDARPLVFRHGLGPAGPAIVDEAAPVWAEQYGFRVLAPVLPGLAGSARVPLDECRRRP